MRKLLSILLFVISFTSTAFAAGSQVQASTLPPAGSQSGADNQASSGTIDTEVDDQQAALDQSFEHVAQLGQQIEVTNKEIQAANLQKQLDTLNNSRNQKNLGFKVYQIIGFDKTLHAVLIGDNGAMYDLSPGENVNDQYRVSLITPNTVKVTDIKSNQTFSVPFNQPALSTTTKTTATGKKGNTATVDQTFTAPDLSANAQQVLGTNNN